MSGTSASSPAFAGILSLVANKTLVRLGQPNYVLYRLAAAENLAQCNASSATLPASTCVFNDVTVGNNAVPGEVNYRHLKRNLPERKRLRPGNGPRICERDQSDQPVEYGYVQPYV